MRIECFIKYMIFNILWQNLVFLAKNTGLLLFSLEILFIDLFMQYCQYLIYMEFAMYVRSVFC